MSIHKSIKSFMHPKPGPVFRVTWKVLEAIATSIGTLPAETGGALGGDESGEEINRFHFDETARRSCATYSPDHKFLNQLFKNEWKPHDIRLKGFVHSHPGSNCRPSHGDEVYAKRILMAIPDLEILWLPIINTLADTGGFKLTPWAAELKNGTLTIIRGAVQVVGIPRKSSTKLWGMEANSLFSSGSVIPEIYISGPDHHRAQIPTYASATQEGCNSVASSVIPEEDSVRTTVIVGIPAEEASVISQPAQDVGNNPTSELSPVIAEARCANSKKPDMNCETDHGVKGDKACQQSAESSGSLLVPEEATPSKSQPKTIQ